MADENTFTGEQIAVAARELRQAAGADEERFTGAQAISMLSEEIRLLRERGFNDGQIADLFTGFDICVSAEEIREGSVRPAFCE
ncbi:MAG TPA: hypothetical protein VKV02_03125 [Acidobacteriaceae bacterium]|nr:hypothetical protein [Acidobacteriaceae bacterium]